ncbi:response regulator transcription factor [Uliginosibacterium gangwonense]|uniref:response regulator transcription factor n=1 Tax=Uliginosibacterium gangwonense TaxID=392736 RepID=UPI00036BDCAB|nr:response regulator transcription factor [Uliginosibacterium gangwonense]
MTDDVLAESVPIQVFIVDDHKTILWGLQRLVESARPHMQVAGVASCREALFASLSSKKIDVIVLDLDLGGQSSIEIIPFILQNSTAKILILTGDRSPSVHRAAILAGAKGIVLKDESAETLLQAIKQIHAGEVWIDHRLMDRILDLLPGQANQKSVQEVAQSKDSELTAREREIIRAVVLQRGAKGIVIAEALNISEHTLRNHLSTIYAKLKIRNRIDLFVYASEHSLDQDAEI